MSSPRRTTLLAFVPALTALLAVASVAHAVHGFPDVPVTHPENEAITLLQEMNAIGGFEDGTFRPDLAVTRAGVVQVALLASGQLPTILQPGRASSYPDVPVNVPSAGFIERAVEKGYIKADGKAPFRPNEPATRAEGLKLALTILEVHPAPATSAPFADLDPKSWEAAFAGYALEHRLLRFTGSTFSPTAPLRRAELARVVSTVLEERRDTRRPLLPSGVAILLALGWLLCAIPFTRWTMRRAWPASRKALGFAAAVVLGPLGALWVIGSRLGALRLRDSEEDAAPRRRLRRARPQDLLRWMRLAEPQLLELLLVVGYMAVFTKAVQIAVQTRSLQAALSLLGNG